MTQLIAEPSPQMSNGELFKDAESDILRAQSKAAQIRVYSELTTYPERKKKTFLKEHISAAAGEIEAGKHILIGGQNNEMTIKTKNVAWEWATASVNVTGQKDRIVADK